MGLAADRLVFVELALPQAKYAERARHLQFLNDVVAELEVAPGIEAATPVNTSPFAGTNGWDPNVQVMRVAPFAELLEGRLARPRFNAFLIDVFGVAALLLAAIGLYAVLAASVRQRYTEIGIRVALGATPSDVRRLVLGEGVLLATLGAAIGFAIAMVTTRLLRGLLYGVHPLDPATMLTAGLLVVGASALASYLAARRATWVDPVAMPRAN
jgi:putative ABC transport system permease protein